MSKIESLNCYIKENIQKIELFKLIDDEYSKITINHLLNENNKLKKLLNNLNKKEV